MRLSLLLLLAALATGCAPLEDLYREVERYSEDVYRSARTGGSNGDVRRDAERYVRDVDRAVRLDRDQERRMQDLLEDRADRLLDRDDRYDRRSDYPFPRSERASREVERWWADTDRAIERLLSGRQRDDYRRFIERYDRYDDRDWDDEDWEDDDYR